MLKEAIDRIRELAVKAHELRELPSDGPYLKRFLQHDGSIRELEMRPSPRDHRCLAVDSLVAIAARFAVDDDRFPGLFPVCWLHEDAVELVLDDEGHRVHVVTYELVESDEFRRLVELETERSWLSQKDFLRLLRVDLGRAGASTLVPAVRRVVWSNASTATIGRQTESMGREIAAKIGADGRDLPEDLVLTPNVYATAELVDVRVDVPCWLEIDPLEQRFRIAPFPGECERARLKVLKELATRLTAALPKTVPLYWGKP